MVTILKPKAGDPDVPAMLKYGGSLGIRAPATWTMFDDAAVARIDWDERESSDGEIHGTPVFEPGHARAMALSWGSLDAMLAPGGDPT